MHMSNKPNTQPQSTPAFEIVDADSLSFVKRGRKPNLDSNLVELLRQIPVGKAGILKHLQQNPQAPTYANDKARIASSIRTACKAAGMTGFSILWSPDGIPQVRR
jgi:hypothetical protein